MYCPNCGAQNVDVNRFCQKCGSALPTIKAAPPTPIAVSKPRLPIRLIVAVFGMLVVAAVIVAMIVATRSQPDTADLSPQTARWLLLTAAQPDKLIRAFGSVVGRVYGDALEHGRPDQVLKFMLDNQPAVDSYQLDIEATLQINAQGFSPSDQQVGELFNNYVAGLTGRGYVDNRTQDLSLSGSLDLGPLTAFMSQGAKRINLDLIKVGDTIYSRALDNDWQATPLQRSASGATNSAHIEWLRITHALNDGLRSAVKVDRLANEMIDGLDTHHFKAMLDSAAFATELYAALVGEPTAFEPLRKSIAGGQLSIEIWLSKRDGSTRQQRLQMNAELSPLTETSPQATAQVNLVVLMRASQFNQPVTIIAPPVSTPMPARTQEPPPMPTATPSCPAVTGVFAQTWEAVKDSIGCAAAKAISGLIAEENFEGGRMFWREPIDVGQALVLYQDGTAQIVKHSSYIEGSPEFSCLDTNTPAQCPPTPKRGFGLIWCDASGVRSRLGKALDCERAYQGRMQQFERGFMLRTDNGAIYVVYNDGHWERK